MWSQIELKAHSVRLANAFFIRYITKLRDCVVCSVKRLRMGISISVDF